ncbi:hypothetical protein QJS10_CPB13g01485 [Acorus calamus]|uniref:Uncharacterized protein n=1 Tax=Acorus calamus TaxID=4465 RepID=A0AAV9DFM3_ACOCL|nr:hypothetical protein QJS10_CPB13g01485 [Acorus calamus]
MAAITTLSLTLIVFFLLFLLLISATLLYVLCYRRRYNLHFAAASAATSSTAGDPEFTVGWDPYRNSSSKELILYFLFHKDDPSAANGTLSLPPPTSDAVSGNGTSPEADVVVDVGMDDFSFDFARRSLPAPAPIDAEEEETPFSTPCASPSFLTPSSSPPRFAAADDGGREGKSSSWSSP